VNIQPADKPVVRLDRFKIAENFLKICVMIWPFRRLIRMRASENRKDARARIYQ
jgi:ribosomal protein S26